MERRERDKGANTKKHGEIEPDMGWDATRAFHDELWDAYEPVKAAVLDGTSMAVTMTKLTEGMAALAMKNAKELGVLHKAFAEKREVIDARLDRLSAEASACAARSTLYEVLAGSMDVQLALAHDLRAGVLPSLKAVVDGQPTRRRHIEMADKSIRALAKAEQLVRSTRAAYHARCAEVGSAADRVECAQQALSASAAQSEVRGEAAHLARAQQAVEGACAQMDRARAAYESALAQANRAQAEAYGRVLPAALHALQQSERERMSHARVAVRAFAAALRAQADEQCRLAELLCEGALAVHPPTDERAFMDAHAATRHRPPPAFMFEPFIGTAVTRTAGGEENDGPHEHELMRRPGAQQQQTTTRSHAQGQAIPGAPRRLAGWNGGKWLRRGAGRARDGMGVEGPQQIGSPVGARHVGHIGFREGGQPGERVHFGFSKHAAATLGAVSRQLQAADGLGLSAKEASILAALVADPAFMAAAQAAGDSENMGGEHGGGEGSTKAEEFFYLAEGSAEQRGPCSVRQLAALWAQGEVQQSSWLWSPSTGGWRELRTLTELMGMLALISCADADDGEQHVEMCDASGLPGGKLAASDTVHTCEGVRPFASGRAGSNKWQKGAAQNHLNGHGEDDDNAIFSA